MADPGAVRGAGDPGRPSPSAATSAAWDFARMEDFWSSWQPLTPYGKERREERRVCSGAEEIGGLQDQNEAWAGFRARHGAAAGGAEARLDSVAWHLGRIPRLPGAVEGGQGDLGIVEIFVVKKFLYNYACIVRLLDAELALRFRLGFASDGLLGLLGPDGAEGESFHLADSLDPRLPGLRAEVSLTMAAIEAARLERDAAIRQETGIDLGGRDFVLVPVTWAEDRGLAHDVLSSLVAIEAWDGLSHVIKPRPTIAEVEAADRLAGLLDEERLVEAEITARLSGSIMEEADRLLLYARSVADLDCARAREEITAGRSFCRPRFAGGPDAALRVGSGRFLPLEEDCAEGNSAYVPLDLDLPERAAVIFGSNMGGKTVVLETLLFLQILAQCGFRVPARTFDTRVYPLIHYVGEAARGSEAEASGRRVDSSSRERRSSRPAGDRGGAGGLSGFGREIRAFVDCAAWSREGALIGFDEFARTTSSGEAEALLSATLESLAARPGMKCLFATHFRGVARIGGVRRLRMRGLDRAAAEGVARDEAGRSRLIQRINALMKYELAEDSGTDSDSDAILIAGLLGLDPSIVGRAEEYHALAREKGRAGKNEG